MGKSYIVILALVLSILSSIAVSANPPDSTVLKQPSSKWHLLFSTQGDLVPVTYMNKSIGIQYSIASDKAIRLTFGLEYGDSSYKRIEYYDSFGIVQEYETNDRKSDTRLAAFYLYYIKYFRNIETVRPYYGGGPFFRYSFSSLRREDSRSISDNWHSISNSDNPYYSTGFILLIGVQYRISDHFQLHANYDLKFAYARRERNTNYKSSNGDVVTEQMNMTESDNFGIDFDYLNLGLSVGF